MRRADGILEHGDEPLPPGEIGPYLDDLDRLGAWFGGYWLTRRAIDRLARGIPGGRTLVVADVGGARGDLAVRLVRAARRRKRPTRLIVLDRDEASLVMGRRAAKSLPEIAFVQADAAALPLRAASVDVATMSLTLHHLEPGEAVAALGELRRAARLGVVINDLIRTRLTYALVWLATRVVARHPLSRCDGPLSVRRAYSVPELRELAGRARLRLRSVRRYPVLARLIAVAS
jgi:methyltransferase family protein